MQMVSITARMTGVRQPAAGHDHWMMMPPSLPVAIGS